jgi:hypothetical protein
MNVKCKYCLQEIPYEATRCPHCGGGIPTGYWPNGNPWTNPKYYIIGIVLGLLILCLMGILAP